MNTPAAIVKTLLEEEDLNPKDYADRLLKEQGWLWHRTRGTEHFVKDKRTKKVIGYVQPGSITHRWFARIVCNKAHGCTGTGRVDFATKEEAAEHLWMMWLNQQSQ